ncbi:MAG: HupE/UreJ family protein [Shimia sp.]
MNRILTTAAVMLGVTATPVLAHHPLNGMPMETFAHGVLSGVGHPVLGFDHLFFVVAMGVAAIFTGARLLAPAAYIVAMLAGCLAMYAGLALPLAEMIIIASLLVVGGLVAAGRQLTAPVAIGLFALFGLFHGSAFGGSIAGQEGGIGGAVLVGYILGLAISQYLIALAAGWVAEKALGATEAQATNARLIGAGVVGLGVFLVLEVLEAPVVAAIAG